MRAAGRLLAAGLVWALACVCTRADDILADRKEGTSGIATNAVSVELRGRVICLPEEMNRRYGVDLPTGHAHVFGFRTEAGDYYTLLRTKLSEALFADGRLRERDLMLKGRTFPGTRILDVTLFRSIHDGAVFDLYYYCDICSIKSVVPGPCMCCREPVELREERRIAD